ncbi:MAG: hypothetical protein KF788_15180 [Piscinibacter sp.]|nr:hypothetical protein [Piscinibacter sp.]
MPLDALTRRAIERIVGAALRLRARVALRLAPLREIVAMDLRSASEALVAMPLPQMLGQLGLAVAKANEEMSKVKGPNGTVMTVQEATIDLNVAISVDATTKTGGELELGLKAFSVNASYSRSFGFKEEASSRISIKLAVVPAAPAA